jgi:hypothetical protein
MDFTNDVMMKMFYNDYIKVCEWYEEGTIDTGIAVSKIKTIQESVGIYVSGVFELKRRIERG